ncbi:MAG: DUF1559 domain-containing protein [Planctomycetia bacterium]
MNNRKEMKRARGFTAVELFVVVGIVLVVSALLLPAIQEARSRANSASCQNNLRQLAGGAHQYHEAYTMLPGWVALGMPENHSNRNAYWSIHAQLLPFVGGSELYDNLNFRIRLPAIELSPVDEWQAQSTASKTVVSVFLCPADANPAGYLGATNYRGCWGAGPYWNRTLEFPDSINGVFAGDYIVPVSFSSVYDGLASTSMFSERTIGLGSTAKKIVSSREILGIPGELMPHDAIEAELVCQSLSLMDDDTVGASTHAGRRWISTGLHMTLYNHALRPNDVAKDCLYFGAVPPVGALGARSFHGGIVNVASADGRVSSVSDAIDLGVWRAYSTRDGGEIVLAP